MEGGITDKHLEHDSANTPPVNSFIVAGFAEHLRGNVVWSSYCGKEIVSSVLVLVGSEIGFKIKLIFVYIELFRTDDFLIFAKAEVAELDVSVQAN